MCLIGTLPQAMASRMPPVAPTRIDLGCGSGGGGVLPCQSSASRGCLPALISLLTAFTNSLQCCRRSVLSCTLSMPCSVSRLVLLESWILRCFRRNCSTRGKPLLSASSRRYHMAAILPDPASMTMPTSLGFNLLGMERSSMLGNSVGHADELSESGGLVPSDATLTVEEGTGGRPPPEDVTAELIGSTSTLAHDLLCVLCLPPQNVPRALPISAIRGLLLLAAINSRACGLGGNESVPRLLACERVLRPCVRGWMVSWCDHRACADGFGS